jgi:hypothetical protein
MKWEQRVEPDNEQKKLDFVVVGYGGLIKSIRRACEKGSKGESKPMHVCLFSNICCFTLQ